MNLHFKDQGFSDVLDGIIEKLENLEKDDFYNSA